MLEKNDVIMIYQDPVTCQKEEGKAELKKKIGEDNNFEYWQVHFIVDYPTEIVDRKILKRSISIMLRRCQNSHDRYNTLDFLE